MANTHFCTCTEYNCPHHPENHQKGCDSCIQKNLKRGEIPSCFFNQIDGDTSELKEYTVDSFVKFYLKNKKAPSV